MNSIENIVDKYGDEISRIKSTADFVMDKVGHVYGDFENEVYTSAFLRMCIMYETFTSDLFAFWNPEKKVRYNHPWSYTRELAKQLKVDLGNAYRQAHDLWEIYNDTKHVNFQTRMEMNKVMNKYKLRTMKEVVNLTEKSLLNLINKFQRKPTTK